MHLGQTTKGLHAEEHWKVSEEANGPGRLNAPHPWAVITIMNYIPVHWGFNSTSQLLHMCIWSLYPISHLCIFNKPCHNNDLGQQQNFGVFPLKGLLCQIPEPWMGLSVKQFVQQCPPLPPSKREGFQASHKHSSSCFNLVYGWTKASATPKGKKNVWNVLMWHFFSGR